MLECKCWSQSVARDGGVWGSVGERCGKVVLGCGRGRGRCGEVLGQVCLGVGEVRGDVGGSVGRCGKVLGEVWKG